MSLTIAPILGHSHDRGGWIVPALIGGVVGYSLSQPQPKYQQPPIYVQPPQQIYVQPAPVYIQSAPPPPPVVMTNQMVVYYCESLKSYYPYIHSCPEGWKLIPTSPY